MKKLIYGALIGILVTFLLLGTGAFTKGAPLLTYVYSNSMEPLIKVNDGFLVIPASNYTEGDIIMYRPTVLEAPYITHRIIAKGDLGFITKGDNSPYEDQESGEPLVTKERIVGKVLTIHGQPIIIPGLGNLTEGIQSRLGNYAKYLSVFFFVLGSIFSIAGAKKSFRSRKKRNRIRLKHLYHGVTIFAMIAVIISIYAGSRVSVVRYLVSEYPASTGNQVELYKEGRLSMEVSNHGMIPVWTMVKGIKPLSVLEAPQSLEARSKETILLDVMPHRETGYYQGYLQIYHYPKLLPRNWVVVLHNSSPTLAIIATGLTLGFLFFIFFKMISKIHGLEEWIPLRAFKDKITKRRFKRARGRYFGRRRMRI